MTTATRSRTVLETLARDYADMGARSRTGMRIVPGQGKTSYTVAVVGMIREQRQLILRAPANDDGSLIAVMKGSVLSCHWINAATAFHFRGLIVRLLFEPVPLIYVDLPPVVERHTLRGVPRALASLRAILKTPEDIETVIVDISTGGVRIAVHEDVNLSKGQELVLLARPHMLGRDFPLSLRCRVTGPVVPADRKHPHIGFYGVNFDNLSDQELLIIHSYVRECLSLETDTLSQMLLLNSREVESTE